MTREEAIERLEWYQCHAETEEDADAFDMAISALRPVSREQVKKVWKLLRYYLEINEEHGVVYIPKFAVEQMIMRLEALKDD